MNLLHTLDIDMLGHCPAHFFSPLAADSVIYPGFICTHATHVWAGGKALLTQDNLESADVQQPDTVLR